MPVQKIKSGRIITVEAPTYVGEKGTIFYDEDTPQLRLSDGLTPGGILFAGGGGYVLPAATTSTLGGIKVGPGLTIDAFGVLTAIATSTYVLNTATTSTLGGIKVGANLTITPDGTLNANTATSGVSDTFKTIKVNSQTDLVAVGNDVIEFKAGTGIIIETSATSVPYQSMTITSTGFGNIDGGMFDTVFDTTTLIFDGGTP